MDVGHQVYLRFPFLSLHLITESHRMNKYRNLISDLDTSFKMDDNLGYKFLVPIVTFWAGMVTYATLLDLGVIV